MKREKQRVMILWGFWRCAWAMDASEVLEKNIMWWWSIRKSRGTCYRVGTSDVSSGKRLQAKGIKWSIFCWKEDLHVCSLLPISASMWYPRGLPPTWLPKPLICVQPLLLSSFLPSNHVLMIFPPTCLHVTHSFPFHWHSLMFPF